jgi:hypothetical protein
VTVDFALLSRLLTLLGVGFLAASLRVFADYVRFRRLRGSALLTWPPARAPYGRLWIGLGVLLGLLVVYKLGVQRRPAVDAFGESMMFLYYAYALPLGRRIGRGFYETGIWADTGFMAYADIGGLTWREGRTLTLAVIHRVRAFARLLTVPEQHYGAARRLLRDRIANGAIPLSHRGLDLGEHDRRDDA